MSKYLTSVICESPVSISSPIQDILLANMSMIPGKTCSINIMRCVTDDGVIWCWLNLSYSWLQSICIAKLDNQADLVLRCSQLRDLLLVLPALLVCNNDYIDENSDDDDVDEDGDGNEDDYINFCKYLPHLQESWWFSQRQDEIAKVGRSRSLEIICWLSLVLK